ncbi:hypothetical protein DM860_012298 [Cuscuta australis]|uniref:Uncharacterized protein n=1 Tax=Cuscuta australis TaxID=267555 RepID=A0A328DUD5_9ASTE|nr:hypothetical protein DM860_012298 [Cuscuta australis]
MYEATPTSPIIAGFLEGNDNLDVGSSFMSIFENNSLYEGVENLGIEPALVGFLRDECEAHEMCDFGGDGVMLNPHPISFASITNVRDATTFITLLEEEGDLHAQGAVGTSANTINCLETHVDANGEDEMDELARKLQWWGLKKVAERGILLEAIQVQLKKEEQLPDHRQIRGIFFSSDDEDSFHRRLSPTAETMSPDEEDTIGGVDEEDILHRRQRRGGQTRMTQSATMAETRMGETPEGDGPYTGKRN